MNKKKALTASIISLTAITGTLFAFSISSSNNRVTLATSPEVWYHYAEIAPTSTRHGSREFWASSTDDCATHQFVSPGVASIDRNFLDNEYFFSLTNEDDRYIAPTSSSPIINGNTVTYGIYPRTVLTDEELISNLDTSAVEQTNGWFLYRGEYYAKVSATPYSGSSFNNGEQIVKNNIYWFKCEPITWKILTNDYVDAEDNHLGYYLLANEMIDGYTYNEMGTNNYSYSQLRNEWLNNIFYNSAFIFGNTHVQTTIVDNSASTTNSPDNTYACANTSDKVFVPSYQDYINGDYGFPTTTGASDDRECAASDWALARGINNQQMWTRSPSSYHGGAAWIVSQFGLSTAIVSPGNNHIATRPAITIGLLNN